MKMIKYLFPLWIGVLIYTLLSVCLGPKGLSAFGQMEAEKDRETANINNLIAINNDLTDIRDVYYNDKENFYVNARELGFAAPGEQFIRIIGLGNPQKTLISPGQVVSAEQPQFISEQIIQIFSFFMSITLLISICVYDFLKFVKEKENRTVYYRYKA
ncbi:MAG: septum formation initiator family protein [Treponema sp.]|nr:septum formation initiator family protein [Treponema sp.]